MPATIWLGIFLVGAFLFQGLLGFIQIKNFSANFGDLRKQGRVLIGKNPKRLRSGSLMLMAIDIDGNVKEARIMKGVTVFAKFKSLKRLKGVNISEAAADYEFMHKFDKLTQQCLLNAYRNYINFKTGQLAIDDLDTSVNIFSMPILEKLKAQGTQLTKFVKQTRFHQTR